MLSADMSTRRSDCDVKYVNELIGRDTIAVMSIDTLNAYLHHGATAPTLERDLLEVAAVLEDAAAPDVDLDQVSMELEREGLAALSASMKRNSMQLASAE